MRYFCFLVILSFVLYSSISAQVNVSDIIVNYHCKELVLDKVLKEISDKYNVQFFYSASKIPTNQRISIDIENQSITTFLNKIKSLTSINYQLNGSKIVLFIDEDKKPRNFSLYGFVEDSLNGERLIGANIIVKDLLRGTGSNSYGYYSLPLPLGEYVVQCSYLGYKTIEQSFKFNEDKFFSFKLKPDLQLIKEVKISGLALDKISSISTSCNEVSIKMMQTSPSLFGEKDPIQFLKMLPGVQSSSEASNGLFVRGSPPSQTTFLLDDAPLFNISHISALFSSINPDAIKDLKLYKSHFPAKYGGVLGSVVDIRLRDGNNQNFAVTGGIGTIASRLTIEGPIVKNKASFIVSARRSYLAQIISLFSRDNSTDFSKIYFYDLNCKINYILNPKNRIFLSGYLSKDKALVNTEGTVWTNSLLSFRWNHVYGSKLFSNATLTASKYLHRFDANNVDLYSINTNLQNYALKYDFSYYPKEKYQIDFGLNANYQSVSPLKLNVLDSSKIVSPYDLRTLERSIFNTYVEGIFNINPSFAVESGIRINYLFNYSKDLGKSYLMPEPFLMARYKITTFFSAKAGYSRNTQFYQGKTLFSLFLPFERVVFTNNEIKPQLSDNITLGLYYKASDNQFEISVEGYYKKLYNQSRFKTIDDLIISKSDKDSVINGTSEAYGIEFSLSRQTGNFTGMISYTLSKVLKKDDNFYHNHIYDPYYDRPHNLAISLNYKFSKRFNLMASWVYMSGLLYNMPIGKYEINGTSVPMYDLESLHLLRMPAYHHLDVAMQYQFKSKGRFKNSISLSVYNVYFRKNLLYYTYRDVYDQNLSEMYSGNLQSKNFSAIGFYMFQFIPAISYEFKF